MVTASGKDASAAEVTVAAADGSEFGISVGALFLRREPGWPKTALGSEAMNLDDYEPGLDVSAAYKSKNGLEANFRYFGLNSWSKNTTTEAFSESISSSYNSEFNSVEINMGWWPVNYLGVFVGPRHLSIDESYIRNINSNQFIVSSFADNELWGGQVGVKADLLKTRRGCTASVWGNAGYYNNAISNKTNFRASLSPGIRLFQERGKSHKVTCAGGAGLDYKIIIVPHVALTTGYEMLWIEKAALAPAQMRGPHLISMYTEDVIYHGVRVALTIDW